MAMYAMSCPARCGERPVLAPAGHPAVDERGVAAQALLGADAEAFGDAGPVALDEDVGALDQVEYEAGPLGRLEVDDHGAFVAVGEVMGRVDAEARTPWAVHPHHVGAEVGEEHGGERAGPDARQLDHAHPGERAGSCHCHQAPSTVTQLM